MRPRRLARAPAISSARAVRRSRTLAKALRERLETLVKALGRPSARSVKAPARLSDRLAKGQIRRFAASVRALARQPRVLPRVSPVAAGNNSAAKAVDDGLLSASQVVSELENDEQDYQRGQSLSARSAQRPARFRKVRQVPLRSERR